VWEATVARCFISGLRAAALRRDALCVQSAISRRWEFFSIAAIRSAPFSLAAIHRYPFNAFHSLLGIAGDLNAPTYAELGE
jgi:hypothetical protein